MQQLLHTGEQCTERQSKEVSLQGSQLEVTTCLITIGLTEKQMQYIPGLPIIRRAKEKNLSTFLHLPFVSFTSRSVHFALPLGFACVGNENSPSTFLASEARERLQGRRGTWCRSEVRLCWTGSAVSQSEGIQNSAYLNKREMKHSGCEVVYRR